MKHQSLERLAQQQILSLNQSFFGVFVTLKRADQIHGCLGFWWPHKDMTPQELIAKVQQLSQDVRFKDSRRLHFRTDVDQDASAVLEIHFMHQPKRETQPDHFSNKTHGLIVDAGQGKRATYLPGVFPNASWSFITQSLCQKAGYVPESVSPSYYSYQTVTTTFRLYNVLFSKDSLDHLRSDVAAFYLKYYDQFVPYEYQTTSNRDHIDPSQAVRNVACMVDVIVLSKDVATLANKPVIANLDYYYQKWLKTPQTYRQASIFLIRAYSLLGIHRARIQLMSTQLYKAMDLKALEPRFELGEAISVLAQLPDIHIRECKDAIKWMHDRAKTMTTQKVSLDSVFEVNWQSQSLHQLIKRNIMIDDLATKVWLLFTICMRALDQAIILDSLETNYLAVVYECLSNIEAVIKALKMDALKLSKVQNQRLRLFAALAGRRGPYGLYYFKDRVSARLDITGHVMSFSPD
jgi:AMMECR1 domain-containing protein